MFRYSTLVLAVVMSVPALWQAFVTGSLDPTSALIRFLIAVPLAGIMLMLPRSIIQYYRRQRLQQQSPVHAEASRTDRPENPAATAPTTAPAQISGS
jgi:hypothetical protein